MIYQRCFFAICLVAVAVSGFAAPQEGGPPPPGGMQGGPGGGRRGFGRGGGMLMSPEVQKELKLSPDQIKKLEALRPPGGPGGRGRGGPGGGGPGGGGPGGPGGGPGGPGGPGSFGGPERDEKVKAILNGGQYKRLQEIRLQMEGPRALMNPDVAQKLGLTADQKKQLEELRPRGFGGRGRGGPGAGGPPPGEGGPPPGGEGGPGGPPPGGPGGGPGGRMGGGPRGPEFRKEMEAKMNKILTSSQRAKLKSMMGKPFDFRMGPGGPPPPRA